MPANKSVIEYPSDREMVFTRVLAAPRELVWAAWTDPEQVILWWGPKGFTNTTHAIDLRVGGVWRYTMHGPDGTDWPNLITYHVVKAPARLEYDHGDDVKPKWFHVVVDFIAEGERTKLVTHMTFDRAGDCENAKKYGIDGHNSTMERLDAHLPSLANADRELVLSRVFAAPRELVWQAMTDPQHVTHWWGPRGFSTTTEKMDFRVGGVWQHVMRGPDGTKYPNHSIFKEIVPLERIVYVHGGRREDGPGTTFIATWTFEPSGKNHTRLTIRQTYPSAEARDFTIKQFGAFEGAKQTFARLAEHLPAMQSRPFETVREFNAPRDLVWAAWTEEKHLKQWFGPKGCTLSRCSLDFRPGGVFHYCMRTPDGHEMWGKWTFREIVAPRKLVLVSSFSDAQGGITRPPMSATWPRETLSTTTLEERDGKTILTLRWVALNATDEERRTFDGAHDSMKQGWGGTMDQLDAYLARAQTPHP